MNMTDNRQGKGEREGMWSSVDSVEDVTCM